MPSVSALFRLAPEAEDDEIVVSKRKLEELLRENERMRREIEELRRRLSAHTTPNVPPSVRHHAPGFALERSLARGSGDSAPWPMARQPGLYTPTSVPPMPLSDTLRPRFVVVCMTLVVLLPTVAATSMVGPPSIHTPSVSMQVRGMTAGPSTGAFAFVSTFEDRRADHWSALSGSFRIVTRPNYGGEPALLSSATGGSQMDVASFGVVRGQPSLSLQVVLDPLSGGTGFVGLAASDRPVALFGVGGGHVWAGPDLARLTDLGAVPSGTAQPRGWTYLTANVYRVVSSNHKMVTWDADVFVDQTAVATSVGLSVPSAGEYSQALILTTAGAVAYTDYILTTYLIAEPQNHQFAPNPSDGYGQGSGVLVSLLPSFTTLASTVRLDSWTIPEGGILSVQINAMNLRGAESAGCQGFFQLGVDLNPGGRIAPWYVPGVNCFPHYFSPNRIGQASPGFVTPPGTVLSLKIQQVPAEERIVFTLLDLSVSGSDAVWRAAIKYAGGAFDSVYTQIEFQASSTFPASAYGFRGSFAGLTISGGDLAEPAALGAHYMLPFAVGVPPSWCFFDYNEAAAGYTQIG
jgi:hypothetical protein